MTNLRHISLLSALLLAPVPVLNAAEPPDTNYDEAKMPPYPLPEALVCFDGQPVQDAKGWREKRRPEILRAFAENVYGRTPVLKTEPRYEVTGTDTHALGGLATRTQVTIHLFPEADAPRIDLLLFIPNAAAKPLPAFLREVPHSPEIWFCKNYRQFAKNEAALPVDQHELLALIAPRPIYVASATEDRWADPRGEFLSALHAGPVYGLFGLRGLGVTEMPAPEMPVGETIGYHLRTGPHDITAYD